MKANKPYPALFICFLFALSCLPLSSFADELDITFGEDGRIETSVGHYEDNAYAVALQDDGKILVGGSSSNGADYDFALVRYTEDGSLDPAFNYDGMATTQVGRGDDEIAALAVQEDGYVVAAGYSVQDGNRDFALVRYTPDGQRDTSFGIDGIVVTAYGSYDDEITAVAIDDEGRILIAGYSTGTNGRAVVVGRYLANGQLDTSFGFEGVSLTGIGDDALARSIDVDESGRIVVSGSYAEEGQTGVMVLRFIDSGQLDTTFGVDGLGLTGYSQDATEGYGVKIHESGAIFVAGSVGGTGDLDAALFKFDEDGLFDADFGENGMLEVEASLEDDMVMAIDIKDDVVYLSGFTTVDGVRQFLFISQVLSSPATDIQEITTINSTPFSFAAGNAATSLNIGERQIVESYDAFMAEEEGVMPLLTTVSQTAFGFMSDDVSYAVAVQPDGMAVAAGISEDNGVTNFAVARYDSSVTVAEATASSSVVTSWIATIDPSDVTRTGALSGGIITDKGIEIVQRGVVFSTVPNPVLDDSSSNGGSGSGGNGGNGSGTTGPVITVTSPTGALDFGVTSTTLSVSTDVEASCRYSTTSGVDFDSMTSSLTTTDNLSHSATISGLSDGDNYYIRCEDTSGNQNSSDTVVTISIATSFVVDSGMNIFNMNSVAETIGGFVVGTANAQTVTDSTSSATSVFDLTDDFIEEGFTDDGTGTGSYTSALEKLRPGTFYYLRAYAKSSGGTVYYGKQVGFKTADSCFIATAAYGSIMHSSVKLLREFRDQFLVTNAPGKLFVKMYYRYSPPVADIIADSSLLRGIVRILLVPLVGMSWLFLKLGGIAALLVITSLFLLPYLLYRRAWEKV